MFISKKLGLGYEEEIAVIQESQEEVCTPEIPPSSPKVGGDKTEVSIAANEKDQVDAVLEAEQKVATKTQNAELIVR